MNKMKTMLYCLFNLLYHISNQERDTFSLHIIIVLFTP